MLHKRRGELAAVGAHYSAHGIASGAHHLVAAAVHPSAWRMHADALPEDRDAYFAETARQILSDADAAGHETVVLSSEYLWGSFPADLYKSFRAGFPDCKFEVVAYVRRPEAWVVSSYLQALKNGEPRTFTEWFDNWKGRWASGIHYFRVINRWNYFLEADKVHVVRYDQVKANVYKAFCDAIGIAPDNMDVPGKLVNPSPSFESIEKMLEVNQSDLPDAEKGERRRLIMRNQNPSSRAHEVLAASEREEIVRLTHASNQLLEKWFVRDGAPLFPAADLPSQESLSVADPA